jgi:hypothetical protein
VLRTCYIHIGMHKTGSTTLQFALQGYSDSRTDYAAFPVANHSIPLIVLFSRNIRRRGNPRNHTEAAFRDFHAAREEYDRILDRHCTGTKDLILSGEGVSTRFDANELTDFRDRLARYFDRIVIIAYVRPFLDAAASLWQEAVKIGSDAFAIPTMDYKQRLVPFLDVFGDAAVQLRPYRRDLLREGDIVADFASVVGVNKDGLFPVDRNIRHSAEATAVLFAHNVFKGLDLTETRRRNLRKQLVKGLAGFGSERISFSPDVLLAAVQKQQDQIDWIGGRVGIDMTGEMEVTAEPFRDGDHVLSIAMREMDRSREHLAAYRKERVELAQKTREEHEHARITRKYPNLWRLVRMS